MANASQPPISGPLVETAAGPDLGRRAAIRSLRLITFRWSVGWFCAAIGAMMLIVPHQFTSPSFSIVRPYLPQFGLLTLLSGVALVIVTALGVRGLWRVVIHIACGGALILFAASLLLAGGLVGATIYSTLGVGVVAAATLRSRGRLPARGDLLAVVMGAGAMATGALMLLVPNQFRLPIYDAIRPVLPLFGLVYTIGGGAMIVVQFRPPPQLWLLWLPHAAVGFGFLAYLVLVSLPSRALTGVLFYGGFGLLLLLLPFLGTAVDRFDPLSLQVRLILALIGAAAVPLTATITLITAQQEEIAVAQTLTSRRLLATALARSVSDYVLLHQNAVGALATTVPLAERSPAEQERLLGQLVAVYPEFFACASYAADGSGIARSDGRPSVQADDIPLFATLQRTAAPALELRRSRTIERPIIAFGAPLLRDGSFSGAVICGLEVKRIAELAQQVALEGDRSVVVVDAADQLVATDMADIATFADLSSYPPVAALRAANNATGSQRYGEPPDERLTAYAQVPGLGWGVVVDRPLADDLSAVRGARELAFGLLLLAITLAALVGAFAARVFTRSLNALSSAVSRFAMGDAAAPLPREGMSEVRRLSAAFDQMRLDLTAAAQGREQAITQRDSFFSVAAHELKTPLTALLGQAQLFQRRARREGQLNEKDQRSLDVVVAQALRLNNLITDLLDVSRLQHGRLTPEFELLDLRALVARVVDEFRPTVEPRIIVAMGLDGPLTPVSGDAMRLEQVLHNLLSNAVKYSPAGGDVFVSLALSGGEAHIAVRDQGIGIPADALPQLFERFFRAANAEPRRIGGMGVGLFVVHEIVALHHGRVEVASVEGQGSTFTVVLPLAEV